MEARLRHNPWSFTSRFVAQERVLFYSTHLRCHSQVFYTECTIRKEHGGSSLVQPWTFYTKCMARGSAKARPWCNHWPSTLSACLGRSMEARPRCNLRPLILSAWLGRSTGAHPRCNPRPSMLDHVEAGGWTHLGVGLDRVERLEEALMALSWMRQRCKVVEAWFPGLSLAHLGSDSTALKQGVYIHLEV
ncbi:hypothetical protein GW17_00049405 [Ensete ventricosum]|nr:hypothetical protein GW17_00049405 [Ensete ventricosum]